MDRQEKEPFVANLKDVPVSFINLELTVPTNFSPTDSILGIFCHSPKSTVKPVVGYVGLSNCF